MEKFLILTHDKAEGSGSLGTFLESIAIDAQTAKLHEGDDLPEDPSNLGAIISMGGSMSVHDEYVYPFLRKEKEFLMHAIEANVPVLGICLGAQLIARACHAAVTKAPVKELGWKEVSITDEGKRDILFQGLSRVIQVFQWHEDAFDIPEGAKFLATSRGCPNQAFKVGKNSYGIQFHIEVTLPMIESWINEYLSGSDPVEVIEVQKILLETCKKKQIMAQAKKILLNFSRIIEGRAVLSA